MDTCELCEVIGTEPGTLTVLTLTVALVFVAYFVLRREMPDLPLHVYQALSSIPSWPR